jgi:hypothetical protein
MAERTAIYRENLAAFTGWIKHGDLRIRTCVSLTKARPRTNLTSCGKKALQAAYEVFLAIAWMHASLRLRALTCPLCPDLGNVNVMEGKGVEIMHCPALSGYPRRQVIKRGTYAATAQRTGP